MPATSDNRSVHPHLVLGAWAAALVEGRRVAVLGDSETGLAELLASAAKRRVHAYDPSPERLARSVAKGADQVSFAPLEEARDLRSRAFDVVIVPQVSALGDAGLDGVVELLAARGVLIVATPSEGDLGYYELYDLVSGALDNVRMFGLAPFSAFAAADFAAVGEPSIAIDTSLVDGPEEPRFFVAVASEGNLAVEAYTLLQVPAGASSVEPSRGPDPAAIAALEAALEDAEKRASAAQRRAARADELAEARDRNATKLSARVAEIEGELNLARSRAENEARRASRFEEAVARAKEAEATMRQLEERHREADGRAERLERQLQRVQRELKASSQEYARARQALEDSHQEDLDGMLDRIAELETALEEAQAKAAAPPPPPPPPRRPPPVAPPSPKPSPDLEREMQRLTQERDGEQRRATGLERRLAQREDELSAVTNRLREAERRVTEAGRALEEERRRSADGGELSRDVERLEARLKERGRIIAELTAQLQEGRRVGRELVRELERAREGASPVVASEIEGLRRRCSQYKADLEALRWQLAALPETPASDADPGDLSKLEAALQAAHAELAELRRQVREAGNEQGHVEGTS